jgi:hypothetical protein
MKVPSLATEQALSGCPLRRLPHAIWGFLKLFCAAHLDEVRAHISVVEICPI